MKANVPHTLLAAACIIPFIFGSGCQSVFNGKGAPKDASEVYDFSGIPAKEYFVGGGYWIRYIPKENGILYVADTNNKRLLATISLHTGESHEIKYDINDEDMISNLEAVGIDPATAVIKLYFVPNTTY